MEDVGLFLGKNKGEACFFLLPEITKGCILQ